ncbi:tetratricopeptide repeat protein [Qipengyuania marisflavi]|uniref:Tetratricopeptide repeat protein n=1 Tax=Qipengyuania marisflavi TaxID=2486356 RepID=A0A5S3P864_9SPHN|nr:tetratricopeptide repeat protein [Qipengyuania marisflavi]TMM48443.1 tetratricopeptide repeat protein [Qipengyuania marisflavi]
MGLSIDEQKAVDRFRTNVVEPSMTKLVILDFYADWCGPCKALTPMLEKVAAEYADKGVILAKIDVDADKFVAAQFQVQSIPTVYAMFQGQPVADLTPMRSESQLKQTIDQLLTQLPIGEGAAAADAGPDVAQLVAMGDETLAGGDAERAAGIFAQIIEMTPDNAAAQAGLVRALAQAGHVEQAQAALAAAEANPALADDPLLAQARSALELAGNRVDDGELAALRDKAQADPADMAARYAYAEAAFAGGDRESAGTELLAMFTADREWNDGAAKAKLLQIFEAVGMEDPWVVATRRQLSRLLFG